MLIKKRTKKRGLKQRGQALVEMAITLPLLLVVFTGTIEIGYYNDQQIALHQAARDGARFAAMHPRAWSNSATAPINTIEGILQAEQPGVNVVNDDAHIDIRYYDIAELESNNPVYCGKYSATSGGFVAATGYTLNSCVKVGAMITVKVTYVYRPLSINFKVVFPNGATMVDSYTIIEDY